MEPNERLLTLCRAQHRLKSIISFIWNTATFLRLKPAVPDFSLWLDLWGSQSSTWCPGLDSAACALLISGFMWNQCIYPSVMLCSIFLDKMTDQKLNRWQSFNSITRTGAFNACGVQKWGLLSKCWKYWQVNQPVDRSGFGLGGKWVKKTWNLNPAVVLALI